MSSGKAGKGMGSGINQGSQTVTGDNDFEGRGPSAAEMQGRNSLRGEDQRRGRNQRQALPDEDTNADASVTETLDKTEAARRRSGK